MYCKPMHDKTWEFITISLDSLLEDNSIKGLRIIYIIQYKKKFICAKIIVRPIPVFPVNLTTFEQKKIRGRMGSSLAADF